MTVQIVVEGRNTPFMLNEQTWRWQSPTDQTEGNFPLIAFVDGKRYELYSDETFAEVER
jgi:hypothetical protein